MKSRFALLAMVVVAAAPLAAQGGGGRGMNIDAMTTQYNLTADQKTKTQVLIDMYNKDSGPLQAYIRAAGRGNADADSTKKQQMMLTDFNTKFKALLDATQTKMFDSVQAARAMRMQGRGGGGR